ncbi:MAG: DNA replication/repair protein RecF [Clostridia bacterium]|nr:DNA replication/repair protein RecF [Clostridia bacterium]
MYIRQLHLYNYRNYDRLTLAPHPGVNLFFGQNGAGKTNLLEAVHYCAVGRSHRTPYDREAVRRGEESAFCGVTVCRAGAEAEIAVRLMPGEGRKKQVFIDRKRAPRLSALMGQLRVVCFSPEDLSLVREGPAGRRRYLDMMISQMNPAYFMALQTYQEALAQRRFILKECRRQGRTEVPDDLTAVYEEQMARSCAVILPERRKMAEALTPVAAEKYLGISGREGEKFGVRYAACLEEGVEIVPEALRRLKENRPEDMARGETAFGPHREDLALTLYGKEMRLYASQGQIRTAALALKLAQFACTERLTGEKPVLLLDDVMSELDLGRRQSLLKEISGAQTFVTCTDESDLAGCEDLRAYRVTLTENLLACVTETRAGDAAEEEEGGNVLEEPVFE